MSIFYNVFFVKTEHSMESLKSVFSRIDVMAESPWIVCDYGDNDPDGLFEPGYYFTKEISAQFGEVIFICIDTRNDQFDYEHSQNGNILRKLSWISDGSVSVWEWVEGEMEAWENEIIFSENNLVRTLDSFYDQDEAAQREDELRSIWQNKEYVLGDKFPLGDATIGMAVQDYFGIVLPDKIRKR